MIDSWDAAGDFAEVLDALETVSLQRKGCREHAIEATAWRFGEERLPDEDSYAGLIRSELTWQIAVPEETPRLAPGDIIVDSAGACSMLRRVRHLRGATRTWCQSIRLEIKPESADRFDLLRPLWIDQDGTPVLEREELLRPALNGFFRLGESDSAVKETGELFMVEATPIAVGDRVRRHRRGQYEVTDIETPSNIGRAWRASLTELAEP